MIHPAKLLNLTRPQLKDLSRIDFDCTKLRCNDCPLGIEPVQVKMPDGTHFTYECVSAYASHLLKVKR